MPTTRRDFTRLAGLSAAALALPLDLSLAQTPARGTPAAKPIGYCIVGLGRISMNQFLPGLQNAKHSRATGIVSGHPEKAKAVAAKYGIPADSIYSYETYDRIRDNPAIDAVYIALPNGMHAEYSVRAAQAGKHVLCEKPMANSVEESQSMVEACRTAGKKLMIGYRCQLEPTHLRAIELVRSGALGKVQVIQGAFGFNIKPGEWRLTRKLAGGGPMMDVGIYPLNACRYLTGEEPVEIQATTFTDKSDPRFSEVEENLAWEMRFPSGALASCVTSYGANVDGYYRVQGANGSLEVTTAFSYEGVKMSARLPGQPDYNFAPQERDPAQFTREADYFAECILEDKPVKPSGEEGLRDMKWIQRIYASAGLNYA